MPGLGRVPGFHPSPHQLMTPIATAMIDEQYPKITVQEREEKISNLTDELCVEYFRSKKFEKEGEKMLKDDGKLNDLQFKTGKVIEANQSILDIIEAHKQFR